MKSLYSQIRAAERLTWRLIGRVKPKQRCRYEPHTIRCITKTNHPSYNFIKNQLGMRAVPYLLEDIQKQHPDGSFEGNDHSFWGACSLFRTILYENGFDGPEIPEPFRGRLEHIRRIYVEWGVKEEFLKDNHVPTIPLRWDQVHRLVPNRFFGLRNYVWRLTTLPNRHRMKHSWDFWRAI